MNERNQRIVDLYLAGMTMEDIGTEIGVTRQRIWQILKVNNGKILNYDKSQAPEVVAWENMINRCSDPNNRLYGGLGIKVCQQWKTSFATFYHDVGPRPGDDYSLDRWPDPCGNYEPGNVRWATRIEQARNKRPKK